MNKVTFVCIDCETTGLDPAVDRIIEVAAVKFTLENTLDSFESLINPECPIPETSFAIHNISQEMVQDKPLIVSVLPRLLELIGKNIIIGHSVGFDIEIIAAAADRYGIPHTLRHNLFFDTLRMARVYGQSPTNSLKQLSMHFNIEGDGHHRAMSDVSVNMEVFKYLAKNYKSLNHLSDVLARPILLKAMPLGPHKGRPMKEIPLEYLRWAAHRDFDKDLLYTIRSELKKRKSGNLFYQSGNPFAEL